METKNSGKIKLEIKELFHVFYQKKWILIVAGVIGSLLIASVNLFVLPPIYTSTSKLAVRQLNLDYTTLVTSRPVLDQVVKDTYVDLTPEELAGMITVSNPLGSRILEVSVTDYDPEITKILVDAIVKLISTELADVVYLPTVKVIEPGNYPTEPESGNLGRSFFSGGVLGVIIGMIIVYIIHKNSELLLTSDDVRIRLGLSVLGQVPISKVLMKEKELLKSNQKNKIDKTLLNQNSNRDKTFSLYENANTIHITTNTLQQNSKTKQKTNSSSSKHKTFGAKQKKINTKLKMTKQKKTHRKQKKEKLEDINA